MNLNKLENENEEQYIWRLARAKDSGELDLEWSELAAIFNKELREEDEYYNESAYRKCYQQAKRFYEAGVFKDLTSEAYIDLIKKEKYEAQKEKQKIRDEKNEINKWMREDARDERIMERICEEIRKTKASKSEPAPIFQNQKSIVGALCIADQHYGTEFCVKGLKGEVINEYSVEVFEDRMDKLLGDVILKIQKESLTNLKIYSLGDELDGILRVSQLMKLRYGVVESTIRYADYMVKWLKKLTEYVNVEFFMTFGNHSELRLINQPKGAFADENMGKVIKKFIQISMEDNPNFTLVDSQSGLIVDEVFGFNILGIHGEVKNMSQAIETFSNVYDTKIDILLAGHKHHFKSETVGINRDVVNIPSIIGVDDYSMTIGKVSNPGATFIIIEEGKGLTEIKTFKL